MPAEIPDGAVIVARAILNSSLWSMRPEDCKVAITCIALANHEPRQWWDGKKTITIQKGQFVRSWDSLAKACVLTVKVVRTCVQNLEKAGFLARERARLYSLFTIPKYQHYQDLTKYYSNPKDKTGKTLGRQRAGNGQATGRQRATNNNIRKNLKKGGEETHAPRVTKELHPPHKLNPPGGTEPAPPRDPGRASEGTGTGALTDRDVARRYVEKNPKVMAEAKALNQVHVYLGRGLTLETMISAIDQEPAGTVIWEIFDKARKNGHAEKPAAPPKDEAKVREAEERAAADAKLREERYARRQKAEQKLKEMPPEELAVWRSTAEEEGRKRSMSGPTLTFYITNALILRAATHFGIATKPSEL